MAYVELNGLHKSFAGNPVLRGFRLEVERGELVTLLGPRVAARRRRCGSSLASRRPTAEG